MSQAHVLVVDDERFFREAIQEVLDEAGIPFQMAESGEQALEKAQDPQVGVVVLDLQLPDLHGLEVFRRLREARPELRVVILSASTDQENVLEALRLGAFDYLAKPLHNEELHLSVRRACETWALESGWSGLRERLAHLERVLGRLWAQLDAADPESVRDAIAGAACEVLGVARTSLLLLDEASGVLRVVAMRGSKHRPDEIEPVPVGQGAAGLSLARREALLVSDVEADPRFAGQAPGGRYRSGSFAVAPLLDGDRAFGVLCATERSPDDPLTDPDLAVLRILAGQAAQMLDRRPALEATGVEEGDSAELVREICEAVTAEVDPTRVLDGVLRPVGERLGAAPVSLFLFDAQSALLCREAERDGGRRSDRQALPRSRGLTGVVFETGAIVAAPDPQADPRFDAEVDTPGDGGPGPFLCGPLRFRGRALGVFRAFPESPEQATPEIGELLAASLSAALRSVTLYRSLVESIEEVARARKDGA